jgi:hypothetical protein
MPLDAVTPEIRRYLLGGLDEAGAAALEERYVADPALLGQIGAAEEGLIDDFLDDRLSAADRGRFEAHYLASPVHRDRVAIARAWRERLTIREAARPATTRATTPAFWGWMLAAAAMVLLALWVTALPGPRHQQVQAPVPPPVAVPTPPPVAPVPAPPPPAPSAVRAVLALTLSPIATRAGDQPVHQRPAGPVDLVLRLEGTPEAGDRAYDAELQTVEGRVVWRGRAAAAAAGRGVLTTLRVPADTLAPDDYVIVIAAPGGDERARYTLRLRTR